MQLNFVWYRSITFVNIPSSNTSYTNSKLDCFSSLSQSYTPRLGLSRRLVRRNLLGLCGQNKSSERSYWSEQIFWVVGRHLLACHCQKKYSEWPEEIFRAVTARINLLTCHGQKRYSGRASPEQVFWVVRINLLGDDRQNNSSVRGRFLLHIAYFWVASYQNLTSQTR